MNKVRTGYYSEALLHLPGRLHVSEHGATIELSAKDSNNKRRLFSLPCDETEDLANKLWTDWQSLESHSDTEIFLFEDCFPIRSEEQLQGICEELRYSFERSHQITALLYAEEGTHEYQRKPAIEVAENVPQYDTTVTDKGSSINLEKTSTDKVLSSDNASAISNIVESLQNNAQKKEEEDTLTKYIDRFSNLKFDPLIPYAGMGKAILLLSVINLADSQIMKSTKVPIGIELEKTYSMLWKHYVSRNVHNMYSSYEQSFIEMADEDFWRLMPKQGKDSVATSPLSQYKCAVIDQTLFEIMRDSGKNATLKSVLIDKYL